MELEEVFDLGVGHGVWAAIEAQFVKPQSCAVPLWTEERLMPPADRRVRRNSGVLRSHYL